MPLSYRVKINKWILLLSGSKVSIVGVDKLDRFFSKNVLWGLKQTFFKMSTLIFLDALRKMIILTHLSLHSEKNLYISYLFIKSRFILFVDARKVDWPIRRQLGILPSDWKTKCLSNIIYHIYSLQVDYNVKLTIVALFNIYLILKCVLPFNIIFTLNL